LVKRSPKLLVGEQEYIKLGFAVAANHLAMILEHALREKEPQTCARKRNRKLQQKHFNFR
jgi:hypothetical protein